MDTPAEPSSVPIGLSAFSGDFKPVRRLVDRDHENVVARHGCALGHYAADLPPDVLVADLRGFYGDLLADHADI